MALVCVANTLHKRCVTRIQLPASLDRLFLRRLYRTGALGIALPNSVVASFTLFDKQLIFVAQEDSPPNNRMLEHLTSAR